MRKMSSRRGFTLAEVLVTVTIVAVLAAVMVPAVINQVAKGDIPSVSQDIAGIRTAITTFAADIRRFPHSLSEVGGPTLSTTAHDILGVAFGTDAGNYHGPYASITQGHVGPTGALFSDTLLAPGGTRSICMTDSTSNGLATGTSKITSSQMAQLEAALDNVTASPKTTGSVQWVETVPGIVDPTSVRVCVTTY
jgi:prepilin-type N-terminal cleavage/methylation domain-containing protein